MKHAYLIIANRNPHQLQLLINMLDDYRNDIYILVDKKSQDFPRSFYTNKSNIYILPRLVINWGDYTQIEAEMFLLKESLKRSNYSYFHLLSGLDLPLVSQNKIHEFFDLHPNREFIAYNKMMRTTLLQFLSIKIRDKIKKRNHKFLSIYKTSTMLSARIRKHLFRNKCRNRNRLLVIYRKIENNFLFLLPSDKNVSFASQWFSIDQDLAESLIKNEHDIIDKYKKGILVDEIFLPTFINEHRKFKGKIYSSRSLRDTDFKLTGNLRYVNWTSKSQMTGSPETLKINDYQKLSEARKKGFFFARKFDENVDADVINKIYSDVLEK